MTKEHAYAYEAGYRDGSIHYELEHCPACKNVADLQEALEENAKLREQLEYALQTSRARLETIDRLKAENAKLRELVQYTCDECYGDDWLVEKADALGIEGHY